MESSIAAGAHAFSAAMTKTELRAAMTREHQDALLFHAEEDGTAACRCRLCARRCRIRPGGRGFCGVRENQDGALRSLVYGRVAAESDDPVEKKPLFHFLPGSRTWSVAAVGCNFTCRHCQNWQLSQHPRLHQGNIAGSPRSPEQVAAAAARRGCRSLSCTYTEPTVFYEFARDCMTLAHEAGLANIFVSNGYMSAECCRELAPLLDGINIDIKAFSEDFYRSVCGGAHLRPVLDSVRLLRGLGVWVEITTLLIPGLNDSAAELARLAAFIRSVDPDMPWHLTAFRPMRNMLDRPPTSAASLLLARQTGLDSGLRFVYTGNVRSSGTGESTFCPSCGRELISRSGYSIRRPDMDEAGACPSCGAVIAGVWRFPR